MEKVFDDCAEGIQVTLKGDGICESAVTDCFGEFKFDGLCPGTYTLEIDGNVVKTVELKDSVNIGEIFI